MPHPCGVQRPVPRRARPQTDERRTDAVFQAGAPRLKAWPPGRPHGCGVLGWCDPVGGPGSSVHRAHAV